jgi:CRP/FNR family transcriptional regulator, cyclic AMP receptor protein
MPIKKESKASHFLKEVNLFDGLDNKVINQIFRLGMVQNFKKGDLVVREGQQGGNLHIVINGKAEVLKALKGKKTGGKRLATLDRGSTFGEMSLFDGAPYSASIRALVDSDIHIIRGSDFRHFLAQNPSTAVEILTTLITSISNRLRRTNLALSLMGKNHK